MVRASIFFYYLFRTLVIRFFYWRSDVVVRASASQLVGLEFIPQVKSYQKTLKNVIHSLLAWHLA